MKLGREERGRSLCDEIFVLFIRWWFVAGVFSFFLSNRLMSGRIDTMIGLPSAKNTL